MSKFIRLYNSHTQYEADELLKPNVSRCRSEKHVHYNPNEIYLRGNIVIPYRGLVDTDSSGGDGGKKGGNTKEGSFGESTCYGDNVEPGIFLSGQLLNVGNDCAISDVSISDESYVDDNGKSFYTANCFIELFNNETQEPLCDFDKRLYNETGIKYYVLEELHILFFINTNKDNVIDITNGETTAFIVVGGEQPVNAFPKIVQKRILTTNDYYNGTNGTTVNAILITDPESEIPFETTTARTVSVSSTQTARIISPALEGNSSQLFTEIKLDGVVTTGSQAVLSEGTHTIEYKLNKKNIPEYGFALCTALSNVTISPKVKAIDPTAFEYCDLLDTDENTIKRVCTITEGETKYEPIIIEAEFDDENIYGGPTNMSVFYFGDGDSGGGGGPKKSTKSGESSGPAHYFAVYNGTSGLHICSSDGGYSPK